MDYKTVWGISCGVLALLASALYARISAGRMPRTARPFIVGGFAAAAAALWLLTAARMLVVTSNRGMSLAALCVGCLTAIAAIGALILGFSRLLRHERSSRCQ